MIAGVAHSVHARDSLAMSCVDATVTQHNSAGDSFFLFPPSFLPMALSFLVAHCTTLIYFIFTDKYSD